MSPTLENGDYILIKKPRPPLNLRPGLIYVLNHNRLGQIVKRLSHEDEKGFWFKGDNPNSSSMQSLGPAQPEETVGRAILRISRKSVRLL